MEEMLSKMDPNNLHRDFAEYIRSSTMPEPARHVATGGEVPVDVVYEPVAGSDTLLSVTLRPHPAPKPVPAPTVDAGPEIDATFAKIREIMEESKPWRNEYELADGDVVREDDRLWNGTKTSEVHHWDGTSVRKARAACGNIGLRFFRKGPAPRAESAPDAREEIEGLIRALAMAAWDEGSDAGVVWCPDADMTKRGVVPMTQEEGLEHSRAHFAEHGAGSPTAPFSIAMHNLRSALAKLEPKP